MLQCRDIDELMIDFLYQELETPRADAFKAHLASCPRCGQELDSLQRVRGAVRELPEAEPPQSVTAKLLHEAAKRAKPVVREDERRGFAAWIGSFFKPIVAYPGWAAAASLVLVFGAVVYFKTQTDVNEKSLPHPSMRAENEKSAPAVAATPTARPAPAEAPMGGVVSIPEKADVANADPAEPAKPATDMTVDSKDNLDGRFGYADSNTNDRSGRTASDEELKKLEKTKFTGKGSGVGAGGDSGAVSRGYGGPVDDFESGVEGGVIGGAPSTATGATSTREGNKSATTKPMKKAAPREVAEEDGDTFMQKEAEERPVAAAEPPDDDKQAPPPPASPPPAIEQQQAYRPKEAKPTEPASTTPRRDTTKDGSVMKTEPKAPLQEKSGNVEDPKKLHEVAKKQANSGDCTAAISTRGRIQRVDADYYKRNVANDKVFAPCDRRLQEERNRKAKQKNEESYDSAPAADSPASKKTE